MIPKFNGYDPKCFHGVVYYTSMYPPKDQDNESRAEIISCSSQFRICYTKKVEQIFSKSELNSFLDELRATTFSTLICSPIKKSYCFSNTRSTVIIKLKKGKINYGDLCFLPYFTKIGKYTRAAMKVALKRFVEELNLQEENIIISFNLVKYEFSKFNTCNYPVDWHTDKSGKDNQPADYTFLTLLSNPKDPKYGWKGGHLRYTGLRIPEQASEFDRIEKGTGNENMNDPSFPIWEIDQTQNDAILFGNLGMQHCITPLTTNSDQAIRYIFIITLKIASNASFG